MTFLAIAALLRRHTVAVVTVLTIACAIGYRLHTVPPVYVENGSLFFAAAKSSTDLGGSFPTRNDLPVIATAATMAQALSPSGAPAGVRTPAGTARYTLAPFNAHNLEVPDYSQPSATLTVTSLAPAATHRAFQQVLSLIVDRMAAVQARASVPARHRIEVYLATDTGTERQTGSRLRVLGGLGALAAVAVVVVATFLDRRRRSAGRRHLSAGR